MRAAFLKKVAVVSAVAAILALAAAVPASANSVPTTGPQISLFNPPATYPANTPFYVEQGAGCFLNSNAADCANASSFFVLSVDGVQQPSQKDVDIDSTLLPGVNLLRIRYLTNFPQGLPAGTHTLTGVDYVNGTVFYEVTAVVNFTS
jgi:hypothetical protein